MVLQFAFNGYWKVAVTGQTDSRVVSGYQTFLLAVYSILHIIKAVISLVFENFYLLTMSRNIFTLQKIYISSLFS